MSKTIEKNQLLKDAGVRQDGAIARRHSNMPAAKRAVEIMDALVEHFAGDHEEMDTMLRDFILGQGDYVTDGGKALLKTNPTAWLKAWEKFKDRHLGKPRVALEHKDERSTTDPFREGLDRDAQAGVFDILEEVTITRRRAARHAGPSGGPGPDRREDGQASIAAVQYTGQHESPARDGGESGEGPRVPIDVDSLVQEIDHILAHHVCVDVSSDAGGRGGEDRTACRKSVEATVNPPTEAD